MDQSSIFPTSDFWPLAIGFLSLSINYFVQGGAAVAKGPSWSGDPLAQERTLGLWGIFLGGFGQLLTGIYLMIGLTWFPVFANAAPLYMAAVAFSLYGIHWFVIGLRRYTHSDPGPEAWMAIPLFGLSAMGTISFWGNGDIPAAILFIGLMLIYLAEFGARWTNSETAEKAGGVFQLLTGVWLFYLAWGVTMNMANGASYWV